MPTLNDLIASIEGELADHDLVGVAGYYLREIEANHPFSVADLRGAIEASLYTIPSDSLSSYPSYLMRQKGYFQRQDGNWDLTASGLRYYGDLVTVPTHDDEPRPETERFIDASPPEDDFYQPLVAEVNRSYQIHLYDATMILTRKLLENLLIEVLRAEVDMATELDAFYIKEQNRFQPFSTVVAEFEVRLQRFRPYIPELDGNFIDDLNEFRHQANSNAHSIQVNISQADIESRSERASELASTLFRLRKQVALAADID